MTLPGPGVLWSILSFVVVIGPLVFIHELGHYLVGRWCGVRAEAFAIGFGRELFGWTDSRGTRWKVCALPLGGYVKFAGDMGPSGRDDPAWRALPAAERAQTFQAKALWQKALIVLAGPVANFLFAIIVFAGVFAAYGERRTPPVAATVLGNSAADRAGMRPGDRVVSIGGRAVDRFEEIQAIVAIRPGEALEVVVDRAGHRKTLIASIGGQTVSDQFGNETRIGLLGIGPDVPVRVSLSPWQLPAAAVRETVRTVEMMVVTLGQIVTGDRSVKEMAGPVGMAKIAGQQASLGAMDLLLFAVLISINLGFINLLPVPMLDGGHLFFYAIEAIGRRPVSARVQEWAYRSGLSLILALMLFVTVNDLLRFVR